MPVSTAAVRSVSLILLGSLARFTGVAPVVPIARVVRVAKVARLVRIGAAILTLSVAASGSSAAAVVVGAAADRTSVLPPVVARAIAASGLPSSAFGLYAQAVIGERTPVALNDGKPFTMASTAKLVTSLAALDLLGPYYRWHTSAYALGPITDGRLAGDLLIVGGGNAQLSSAALAAWFRRLHDQGLHEIDGDIVIDPRAFDLAPADHDGTPRQSASEPRHVWPAAMTLDEGVVDLVVRSGRGARAVLSLQPTLAAVTIDDRLTVGGDSRNSGNGCTVAPQWQAGPASDDGRARVVVTGNWAPGCGSRTVGFVPPPDSGIAARALPAMWAAAGGLLRGRVVSAPTVRSPAAFAHRDDEHRGVRSDDGFDAIGAVGVTTSPVPLGIDGEPIDPLSFDRSKPLTELLRDINKVSDNVGARNLMLSLSPGFPARPATLDGARRQVAAWLRGQGLADGDVVLETGSGLSHAERARPRALVQLLRTAWRTEQAQAFFDSLPIAGVDGTLKHRLTGGRAAGQAYLKTGTLNDTRALAGYVHGASGTMYAVALIVNSAEPERGRPVLDAVVEWLARNG